MEQKTTDLPSSVTVGGVAVPVSEAPGSSWLLPLSNQLLLHFSIILKVFVSSSISFVSSSRKRTYLNTELVDDSDTGVDPCASAPCKSGGICEANAAGDSFICDCPTGTVGLTCGKPWLQMRQHHLLVFVWRSRREAKSETDWQIGMCFDMSNHDHTPDQLDGRKTKASLNLWLKRDSLFCATDFRSYSMPVCTVQVRRHLQAQCSRRCFLVWMPGWHCWTCLW